MNDPATPSQVPMRLAKETARRFARRSLWPLRQQTKQIAPPPLSVRRAYGELGLGLAHLSREVGGVGLGPLAGCVIAEALAAGDVNAAFGLPQPGPFADAVALLGNRHQRKIWLHPFLELAESTWGAFVIGPPGAITALMTDDGLRLSGRAPLVWAAPLADRLVVVADVLDAAGMPLAKRVVVVVARAHEGLSIVEPADSAELYALRLMPAASVRLSDVRVPKSQWLDAGDPDGALRQLFALQALRMASYGLGAARAASAYTLDYAERRRRAGKPLAQFQSMGFLLVDMHLACETAFNRLQEVAGKACLDEQEVLQARASADEVAFFVTDSAMQILAEDDDTAAQHPVAAWHADVKLLAKSYRADAYFAPAMQAPTPVGETGWLC